MGGARTAVFNYLFAQNQGGTFILRVEDTDRNRYNPEALENLLNDMKWLGLNWDEGPENSKGSSEYFQSNRLKIYEAHIESLLSKGAAYPCFCKPEPSGDDQRWLVCSSA